MGGTEKCLRFEDYYFSDDEADYKKDTNQRNIIIKQINQLIKEKKKDIKNLQRLVNNVVFFRNVFTKEAILEFFNSKFEDDALKVFGDILYELIVTSKDGKVGNHRRYADEVFKLMRVKGSNEGIVKLWEELVSTIK